MEPSQRSGQLIDALYDSTTVAANCSRLNWEGVALPSTEVRGNVHKYTLRWSPWTALRATGSVRPSGVAASPKSRFKVALVSTGASGAEDEEEEEED